MGLIDCQPETTVKIKTAELAITAYRTRDFIRDDRPQIAFAGRSNVGKSTLLNRLIGRKALARTSSTPGRTRSVNYFLINGRFYLVDLPGFGYAKAARRDRESWARLIDDYLRQGSPRIDVVILIDAKIRSPLDTQAVSYFSNLGLGLIVVATKIDRIPRNKRFRCLASIAEHLRLSEESGIVPVSAQTGEGIKELWSRLNIA